MRKSKTSTLPSILGFISLLLLTFVLWFYISPASQFKNKIANFLPLPIAFVGNKPIYEHEIINRLPVAQIISQADQTTLQTQILNRIIEEKKTAILAARYGIAVSTSEAEQSVAKLKLEANTPSTDGFKNLLQHYNLTEQQFTNSVVKPELLYTNLIIWFNSNNVLNKRQYELVNGIMGAMSTSTTSTSTFISLVKKYSQDNESNILEGDLGFVEINKTLPEFTAVFDGAKKGDTAVIGSRYGIHIFLFGDRDTNGAGNTDRVQVRQIFLKPENFDIWFSEQSKTISVKKLM